MPMTRYIGDGPLPENAFSFLYLYGLRRELYTQLLRYNLTSLPEAMSTALLLEPSIPSRRRNNQL
jgi:hypothetical protein